MIMKFKAGAWAMNVSFQTYKFHIYLVCSCEILIYEKVFQNPHSMLTMCFTVTKNERKWEEQNYYAMIMKRREIDVLDFEENLHTFSELPFFTPRFNALSFFKHFLYFFKHLASQATVSNNYFFVKIWDVCNNLIFLPFFIQF